MIKRFCRRGDARGCTPAGAQLGELGSWRSWGSWGGWAQRPPGGACTDHSRRAEGPAFRAGQGRVGAQRAGGAGAKWGRLKGSRRGRGRAGALGEGQQAGRGGAGRGACGRALGLTPRPGRGTRSRRPHHAAGPLPWGPSWRAGAGRGGPPTALREERHWRPPGRGCAAAASPSGGGFPVRRRLPRRAAASSTAAHVPPSAASPRGRPPRPGDPRYLEVPAVQGGGQMLADLGQLGPRASGAGARPQGLLLQRLLQLRLPEQELCHVIYKEHREKLSGSRAASPAPPGTAGPAASPARPQGPSGPRPRAQARRAPRDRHGRSLVGRFQAL